MHVVVKDAAELKRTERERGRRKKGEEGSYAGEPLCVGGTTGREKE